MKKEISMYGAEYLDGVVFDLLYFLNQKMDSNEDIEIWYSDLEYPGITSLGELYDNDQGILFSETEYDMQLHLLDNDKLLLINSKGPDYINDLRTYFWFALLSNASNYVLRTTKEENSKITFELDDGKGNVRIYPHSDSYHPKNFSKEAHIVDLLKPISFEQLYERGHVRTLVKKRKKLTKKKSK